MESFIDALPVFEQKRQVDCSFSFRYKLIKLLKSGQIKPGKMFKMSTEGG